MEQENLIQEAREALYEEDVPLFKIWTDNQDCRMIPVYSVDELKAQVSKHVDVGDKVILQGSMLNSDRFFVTKDNISQVMQCSFDKDIELRRIQLSMYNEYLKQTDRIPDEELADYYQSYQKEKEEGESFPSYVIAMDSIAMAKMYDEEEYGDFQRIESFDSFVRTMYPQAFCKEQYATEEEQEMLLILGEREEYKEEDIRRNPMRDFQLKTDGISPCEYNRIDIQIEDAYQCGGWRTREEGLAWMEEVNQKLQDAGFQLIPPERRWECFSLCEEGKVNEPKAMHLYLHPVSFTGQATAEQTDMMIQVLKSCHTVQNVCLKESVPLYHITEEQYRNVILSQKKELMHFIAHSYLKSDICNNPLKPANHFAEACRLPIIGMKDGVYDPRKDVDIKTVCELTKELSKSISQDMYPNQILINRYPDRPELDLFAVVKKADEHIAVMDVFTKDASVYAGRRTVTILERVNQYETAGKQDIQRLIAGVANCKEKYPADSYERAVCKETEKAIQIYLKERNKPFEKET